MPVFKEWLQRPIQGHTADEGEKAKDQCVYIDIAMGEETQNCMKSYHQSIIGLHDSGASLVKVLGIGQDLFDLCISAIKANARDHFEKGAGMLASSIVDHLAIVEVFVNIRVLPVSVVIGVYQYRGNAEEQFDSKKYCKPLTRQGTVSKYRQAVK
jgi:hypothetical protein